MSARVLSSSLIEPEKNWEHYIIGFSINNSELYEKIDKMASSLVSEEYEILGPTYHRTMPYAQVIFTNLGKPCAIISIIFRDVILLENNINKCTLQISSPTKDLTNRLASKIEEILKLRPNKFDNEIKNLQEVKDKRGKI